MHCDACGEVVPAGARFCPGCGAPQGPRACASCGEPLTPNARFCAACGARTGGAEPAAKPAPAAVENIQVAERRVTSVLFADLVGFTPMSEVRDPEDVRELLSAYFAAARAVIERYGGAVEKFIGDAVMAVWGVPVAHEDDAERAVRAGLELVDEVLELGHRVGNDALRLRVGIVTGEVAATVGAVGEGMVAGDAVNTAARVQSVAAPGTVWVDDATRFRTAAAISYADAGSHLLKGKSEPMPLFRAQSVVAAVGGAQRADGLEAAFVGRERELRMVKELFHAVVEDGYPRLAAVTGVAGVGKSRLAWEYQKYCDGIADTVLWHTGRALSYGDGVSFWALAEMVRARLGLTDTDAAVGIRDRFEQRLQALVSDAAELDVLRPRLEVLLGIADTDSPAPAHTREELFSAWSAFFHRVSGPQRDAVVLVFEDMQYADSGLLDFITHLVDTARFPLFVLTLARPELVEMRPDFATGRRSTSLYLEPLGDQPMAHLVDGLVQGLPEPVRAALVGRAEGIPLYAVETIRALIDRDAVIPREGRYVLATDSVQQVDLDALGAPASLQALIAARLDALPSVQRQVVADASVHGISFERDALAGTCSLTDGFDEALADLVRKEIFSLQADPLSAERGQYRFVQALVRSVAYDTLSRRDRKSRHLAVARFLQSRNDADDLVAVQSRHFLDAVDAAPNDPDAADLLDAALELLDRAGARAEALGSPEEALRHYRAGLDRDPPLATRARLAEGAARAATASDRPEDAAAYAARARDDYAELGRPVDAGRVTAILGYAYFTLGRLNEAASLMTKVYDELVDQPGTDDALLPLADEIARVLATMYDSRANDYNTRAFQIAESRNDHVRIVRLLNRFAIHWFSNGMPTGGMVLLEGAIAHARRLGLTHGLILPLLNLAAFSSSRDLAAARAAADEALELSVRVGARDLSGNCASNVAIVHWLAGSWDVLEQLYDEHGARAASPASELTLRLLSRLPGVARGDAVDFGPVAPQTADNPQQRSYAHVVEGLRAASRADRTSAVERFTDALGLCLDAAGVDDDFAWIWPVAIDELLRLGDVRGARQLVDLVATQDHGVLPRLVDIHLRRGQALVALAEGAPAEDHITDLMRVADECRAFGATYYLGRTLSVCARLLAATDDPAADAVRAEGESLLAGLGVPTEARQAVESPA